MSDRELDRAVALALGYTHQGMLYSWYEGTVMNNEVPAFSTDMALAFAVLEERFPWPQYLTHVVRAASGLWRCDIELRGGDGPTVSCVDHVAAAAIAKAALAAWNGLGHYDPAVRLRLELAERLLVRAVEALGTKEAP